MRASRTSERFTNVADQLRVVFAGGGTGGHLFPALAIAEEVKKLVPETEILFVGTKGRIEARVVPQQGYRFETVWISGFRRSFAPGNLVFPIKVVTAVMQASTILKNFRPHVVVGTGGYVSGPMLYAASRKKIPTLIQEQNSYPGVTTRMLAKRVNEVHLTFESSKKYFDRKDNLFVSGNPTRSDLDGVDRLEALRYFGFTGNDRKAILVFGGSLGAHSINRAVERSFDEIMKQNIRLIWQTGQEDFESMSRIAARAPGGNAWIGRFIDRMEYAYAASDLVVCRSGATTLAELTRIGKPAILVPYPQAAANHQAENARSMAESGAAEIIDDTNITAQFLPSVLALLEGARLRSMAGASKKLGRPDAAREIAERILNLAKVSDLRKGNQSL